MIAAFEQASGQKVPYDICPRRAGDVASVYADASRARDVLGFQAQFDVADMCRDAWHWQSQNPHGYVE
jgi:UDP-glucose 4-epimerase